MLPSTSVAALSGSSFADSLIRSRAVMVLRGPSQVRSTLVGGSCFGRPRQVLASLPVGDARPGQRAPRWLCLIPSFVLSFSEGQGCRCVTTASIPGRLFVQLEGKVIELFSKNQLSSPRMARIDRGSLLKLLGRARKWTPAGRHGGNRRLSESSYLTNRCQCKIQSHTPPIHSQGEFKYLNRNIRFST